MTPVLITTVTFFFITQSTGRRNWRLEFINPSQWTLNLEDWVACHFSSVISKMIFFCEIFYSFEVDCEL